MNMNVQVRKTNIIFRMKIGDMREDRLNVPFFCPFPSLFNYIRKCKCKKQFRKNLTKTKIQQKN